MSSLRTYDLLSGHSASVLCCEVDTSGHLLASGSEDASARLWDLRTLECCQSFSSFGESEVTSVTFSKTHEHQVFVAAGQGVKCFDFRTGGESEPVASYEFNREEINQIAVNRKGTFLAAADDSGEAKVVDLATNSVFKTLRGVHTNICSGVQFHPKKIWEVVTGGLDAKLVVWDFSKGRPLRTFDLADEARAGDETSAQLFNPPLIHSVATLPDDSFPDAGHLAVVSRGDGAVAVYDLDHRERAQSNRGTSSRVGANKSAKEKNGKGRGGLKGGEKVTSVSDGATSRETDGRVPGRWCCFGAEQGGHKSSAAYAGFARFGSPGEFLISGGNDGRVNLWRWQDAAEAPSDDRESDQESERPECDASQEWADGEGKEEPFRKSGSRAKPLLLSLRHGKKVNWLATSQLGEGRVIVADTSRHMRMYTLK